MGITDKVSLRPATAGDFDFLWELHRRELRPYVTPIWGWDEAWQLNHFQERFDPGARQIILFEGLDAGALGVEWQKDALYIAYIAVKGEFQGRGIGTAVIRDLLRQAHEQTVPLALSVLKGNPARGLYERLGFRVTREEETRYWMEALSIRGGPVLVRLHPASTETLMQYGSIPITFEVRSILEPRLREGGAGGFELREVELPGPYVKEYDALPGGRPESWVDQFDLDKWAIFLAEEDNACLAGAAVARDIPGLFPLPGLGSQAVLWDIRVHPAVRGRGIGTRLIQEVVAWARDQGCQRLIAETQNSNVPACRFYARRGFELRAIDRFAYVGESQTAHEIMLLWQKSLN